jgi:hypothetical protein
VPPWPVQDPDHLGLGKIEHVSFIRHQSGPFEFPVNVTDVDIKDNTTTLVSVVAAIDKPNVHITTTSLPGYTGPQPVQVQLEASGGMPPYDWSFVDEYVTKPSVTPEPLIAGTSIQVHDETKSFAPVALPFSFPFYGKRYDSIYVNYFGFIAFEPQNLPAPYITDEMSMLRMFPLIVPSFSQQYTYQANKNDGIWFQAEASHAIIRWKTSVSRYVTTSTNDFAVILYPDGRFEFCFGTMDNQGFVHSFYNGISKGDDLNYEIQHQWNANEISGKGWIYDPPVKPEGFSLSPSGLLSVYQADSSVIYGLNVRASDAGKISASKVLMLSNGLGIVEELLCGADARLKSGQQASLKLLLTNNGSLPIQNLTIKIRASDSLVEFTDSTYTLPLINPGQSLTIPTAFSFKLRHPLPNDFPVVMSLFAQSANRSWKKELLFPVAAPEIIIESTSVKDGYNNRLDPGEVAELLVTITNSGALTARNLQLNLVSTSQDISILSTPLIPIDHFDVSSSKDFLFQIKASRYAPPGSDAAMQIKLNDSTGVLQTLDFNLQIGTKAVALVNLATQQASALAMMRAFDSLNVGYDYITSLPFDYGRYTSVFLILGTSASGAYVLTENECVSLASYLELGGKLYMEAYYSWYYHGNSVLHPLFQYTSKKVPVYYYPDVKGIQGTFTESMSYIYTAPVSYAIFALEPVAPAFSTMVNLDNPGKNLEIVYDGSNYKTIASMLDFSALSPGSPGAGQKILMQRYLEFFNLNIDGPFPLFHAATTSVCRHQTVTFTDDSYDNIVSRSWEFQGGTPAVSSEENPVVTYDGAGQFDVKLTISDGSSTRTIVKSKYIGVDHCEGTPEDEVASPLFSLYPNPANEYVTIEFRHKMSGSCKITMYDLTGCIVRESQMFIPAQNRILLTLSGVAKGFYFLTVQVGELVSTVKVVKN